MELTVTYGDGTKVTTPTKPADLVAFERHFDTDFGSVSDHPRAEHTFFLAWNSLRRTKKTELSFDDWLDTVDDLDTEEDVPLEVPSASSPE